MPWILFSKDNRHTCRSKREVQPHPNGTEILPHGLMRQLAMELRVNSMRDHRTTEMKVDFDRSDYEPDGAYCDTDRS